ncbi:MAG TPA: YbaB/EbfC family nucleoid-associated protein [Rectinemataceae bacterium]|nr:YbaB/EbfC family nucleoid-associated protein [Rectinemataceae bacterium]
MEISDLMNMLKNPQAIQAKANELKQKTAAIRATGQSGGGMVKVTLSGEMEMLECSIAPEAIDPSDPKMIEDLIRAAHHDAAERVQEAIRSQMSEMMGGMPAGMFGGGNPFGGF